MVPASMQCTLPACTCIDSFRHLYHSVHMLAALQAQGLPQLGAGRLGTLLALPPRLLRRLSTFTEVSDVEQEPPQHDKSYVDRLKITARAGKGGNGCASFYQGASRGGLQGDAQCAA